MENLKMEKYYFEEIILILLILKSDLSTYSYDDLMSFNECIEGRIEVLFTKDFLLSLNEVYVFNSVIIDVFEKLKNDVIILYESQWFKKLAETSPEIVSIRLHASMILAELKISDKEDPKKFSETHLNIDW